MLNTKEPLQLRGSLEGFYSTPFVFLTDIFTGKTLVNEIIIFKFIYMAEMGEVEVYSTPFVFLTDTFTGKNFIF